MTWEEIISRPMTREEAIKQLKEFIILHQEQHGWDVSTIKALEIAIKALEQNAKYRKEAKRWKNKALEQKRVLDKIRDEIEQVKSIMNEEIINNNRKDLINFVNGLNQSLVIIERYKTESEDKE